MKITEIRDWATREFGAHSHKEGQVLAALGPLEEWLGHLAKQGVNFELILAEDAAKLRSAAGVVAKPLHAHDEPPSPMNSGAVGTVEIDPTATQVSPPSSDEAPPVLDPSTFVDDSNEGFVPPASEGAPK